MEKEPRIKIEYKGHALEMDPERDYLISVFSNTKFGEHTKIDILKKGNKYQAVSGEKITGHMTERFVGKAFEDSDTDKAEVETVESLVDILNSIE